MPAFIGNGGNKEVEAITIGTAGGNKAVQEGWIGTAGGNKLFYTSFSASVSPTSLNGFRNGAGFVQTNAASVVTVQGGGSYAFLWQRISGSTQITANTPTSSTSFFGANVSSGQSISATFRCQVTDTGSSEVIFTGIVSVQLDSVF